MVMVVLERLHCLLVKFDYFLKIHSLIINLFKGITFCFPSLFPLKCGCSFVSTLHCRINDTENKTKFYNLTEQNELAQSI